ncbi:hypothetical protein LTR16_002548 [Cryomyces antarcticus]|uniref:Yeast cell wall synthesis Kre9/Knh1-like N-terminal domain-containing protein n=1 Tax=Cryomyces antarcticus TaxID=329879 RepID=A0ABR0KT54_9PEZI|nr:hypothetical protein LTR39_001951 [Cryomyces antarcticus]KAK5017531.1 hypothetical protein LTR60_001895 [Cryomyces antarcticus]KAK5128606.1 hypothetical protein LTR16_002548 [Cryomyces antarcticus]
MFFTKALLFGASLVGAVIAQSSTLAFTSVPAVVTAGQPANISYMAADTTSPVTITLRKGDPNNLATIAVLTSSSTGGSYIWIPDKSLANAQDYALQITQGVSAINYSGLITLVGSDTSAVASASAASSSSSAAAAAVTSSVSISSQVQSILSVIASYNSSLVAITATSNATTSTIKPTAPVVASTAGTGIPMSRNTTMSMATLTASSSGSASVMTTTVAVSTTTRTAGSSSTGSSANAATSSPSANSGASGLSSPLALALCVFAAIAYLN